MKNESLFAVTMLHTLHCLDKMRNSIFAKPIGMAISDILSTAQTMGRMNVTTTQSAVEKTGSKQTHSFWCVTVLCLSVVIALTIYGMFG